MLNYNQITDIIAELLFKHDCVIVPNFGGFVARHYGSNYNKGSNLLYPQSKHILFNKNLIHNDGLLISALMQRNNISVYESTKQIEDYKDYIQSLLSIKKRFELNNIGLFYIDNEHILRFEAKANVNFLLDSFGFEPVVANELSFEIEKPIVSKQFQDRKIVDEQTSPKKKSYAKIIILALGIPATIAFLLFAANSKPIKPLLESSINPFYIPEKTYTPNKSKHHRSLFIHPIEKPSLLMDAKGFASFKLSENGRVLVAYVDSIAKKDRTFVTKSILNPSENYNSFGGKYQVVLGCFSIEKNANKLVQELQNKNISAGISGINNKGLHVVSCGSFESKKDATNMLTIIRNEYPNAWVMTK